MRSKAHQDWKASRRVGEGGNLCPRDDQTSLNQESVAKGSCNALSISWEGDTKCEDVIARVGSGSEGHDSISMCTLCSIGRFGEGFMKGLAGIATTCSSQNQQRWELRGANSESCRVGQEDGWCEDILHQKTRSNRSVAHGFQMQHGEARIGSCGWRVF